MSYEHGKKVAWNIWIFFGEGNFFLELQDHGIKDNKSIKHLVPLCQKNGIALIVKQNDHHYIYCEKEGRCAAWFVFVMHTNRGTGT